MKYYFSLSLLVLAACQTGVTPTTEANSGPIYNVTAQASALDAGRYLSAVSVSRLDGASIKTSEVAIASSFAVREGCQEGGAILGNQKFNFGLDKGDLVMTITCVVGNS